MLSVLDNFQLEQLLEVLDIAFFGITAVSCDKTEEDSNDKIVGSFISSKRIEGCSEKSLKYYQKTITNMLVAVGKQVKHIDTDDLRKYLTSYQEDNNSSRVTIDNIRRILSSFFSWLEEENYIMKSPVRRIHKIKTASTIKDTYTDEALEQMRDDCTDLRDLALIDMLASTGMRVGELVLLNRSDIDFEERECVVLGKGNKERIVYFDARTKLHLKQYLDSRTDDNEALFVSLKRQSLFIASAVGGRANKYYSFIFLCFLIISLTISSICSLPTSLAFFPASSKSGQSPYIDYFVTFNAFKSFISSCTFVYGI